MGAELFHADGRKQTDRKADVRKPLVAFRSFANVTKTGISRVSELYLEIERFPRINSIPKLFIFMWVCELCTVEDLYHLCAEGVA